MYVKLSIFIFVIFGFVLTNIFDPEVTKIDHGVYSEYTQSIVQDGDLNIVNQATKNRQWLVTKTYNHPDFHDHGIIVFWAPFYWVAHILSKISPVDNFFMRQFYDGLQVLLNYLFGILVILLSYRICKKNVLNKKILLGFIFSTPFFWYWIMHPSQADITSAICPVLFFYFVNDRREKRFFLVELWSLFCLFTIVKINFGFYILWPVYETYKSDKDSFFIKLGKVSLGLVLCLVPFFINEYLKYGFLHYGYFSIVNKTYYLLFETLFGPSGYFTVSPFYIVVLVLFCYYIFRNRKNTDVLVFIFISSPIIRTLIEANTYGGNSDFGARHYIIDFFPILYSFSFLIKLFTKRQKFLLYAVMTLCLFWTQIIMWSFVKKISNEFISWGLSYRLDIKLEDILRKLEVTTYRVTQLFQAEFLNEFLVLLVIILLFILAVFVFSKKRSALFSYLICSYIFFTFLNISNNKSNVEIYKSSGFFSDTVVGSGKHIYAYDDNMGNILMMKEFGKNRNQESLNDYEGEFRSYRDKILKEIEVDNNNFRAGIVSGDVKKPIN